MADQGLPAPVLDQTDHALALLREADEDSAADPADTQAARAALAAIGLPVRHTPVGGNAPPPAIPAVHALEHGYGDGVSGDMVVQVQDTGTANPGNAPSPPATLNAPLPPAPPPPSPNANAPVGVGAANLRDEPYYRGNPRTAENPAAEPREFPDSVSAQGMRPFHQAGAFIGGTNLINATLEQSRLGMIEKGASPHISARPRQQDRILNDPSHPDNVYANATPEERAALQREYGERDRAFSTAWTEHIRKLMDTPDVPKLKDDPAGYAVGKMIGSLGDAVGGAPGLRQLTGTDDVFYGTLKEKGYDPTDPESVFAATRDRDFQKALKANLDRYWIGAAGDAAGDAGEKVLKGAGTKWIGKKVRPKLAR